MIQKRNKDHYRDLTPLELDKVSDKNFWLTLCQPKCLPNVNQMSSSIWAARTNDHLPGWLRNSNNLFLTDLEAGRGRHCQVWCPVRASFLRAGCLLTVTHMEEGARVLSWASFMRTLPSCPNYFLTASLSNSITLGIRISTYKLWGNINMLVYFIPFVATVWFWLFKEQLTALNHIRMCYNIGTGTLRKWFNLSLHQFSLW